MRDNIALFGLDEGEYTFDIYGTQIFPNERLKYSIFTQHTLSVYNISGLTFAIMGDIIKAPKVRLHVQPAIIDDTGTRLNMDISARFAHIAGQWVSTSCYTPEIKFFTAYTIDLLTKFYTVMYFRRSYCNS